MHYKKYIVRLENTLKRVFVRKDDWMELSLDLKAENKGLRRHNAKMLILIGFLLLALGLEVIVNVMILFKVIS